MKRFMKIAVATLLVVATLFATGCSMLGGNKDDGDTAGRKDFIEDLGGVSETYKGAVSTVEYETSTEAAEAYVIEEISGNNDVSIVDVTSNGKLSKSEIKELDIPEEDQEGMLSVEEIEVEYRDDSGTLMLASGSLNKTRKIKVYIIKYENYFKYFDPAPVTGKTISKSYYDSVFNAEKYENCTFTSKSVITLKATSTENGKTSTLMSMNAETEQLMMYDDGKIYLEQIVKYTSDGKSDTQKMYAYIEEVDDEIVCYVKIGENSDWYEGDVTTIGFSSIEQITPFYDQYLDYTYFTKTSYGFEVGEENGERYVKQVFDQAGVGGYISGDDSKFDLMAEYYVSDGVLSGMRMDVDLDISVEAYGASSKVTETAVTTITCKDYGKTVVEKPFED